MIITECNTVTGKSIEISPDNLDKLYFLKYLNYFILGNKMMNSSVDIKVFRCAVFSMWSRAHIYQKESHILTHGQTFEC